MKQVSIVTMLLLIVIFSGAALAQTPDTAYFYAGSYFDEEHLWHDTVEVVPNHWVEIPIYYMGDPGVRIEALRYVLGCKQELIDTIDVDGGPMFYPLTEWSVKYFHDYNYDTYPDPNPPGYISYSFGGWARVTNFNAPLLQSEIPIHILSFRVHTANSGDLIGTTRCDALIAGMSHAGESECCDSTGEVFFPMDMSYACLKFIEGYEYLPGDVNMAGGAWPPAAIGGDVTYLVGFFRSPFPASVPCRLNGALVLFWASADANGDCNVIGSDVTFLVNVFRGLQPAMKWCEWYPPLWPTPLDLPPSAPPGWPGCEQR